MKSTLDDLKTRRSCRAFTPEPLREEDLNAILEAGTFAPTGRNRMAPVIVVTQDKALIAELSRMNAAIFGVDTDPFFGAGTLVIVFSDSTVTTHVEDGSLVLGNIMNAAHAIGVGSCWIHRARQEFESPRGKELMRAWGLDERYVGIGHCILGYPAESAPAARPRKEGYVIRV